MKKTDEMVGNEDPQAAEELIDRIRKAGGVRPILEQEKKKREWREAKKIAKAENLDIEKIRQVGVQAWPAKYIPVKPTPLQLAFCCLPTRSVLFGGSAGSGKSECLLMAALQYIETPGYSAVIARRTYADLARPGALMDRAMEWLSPHLGKTVAWDPMTKTFRFISGASLTFVYLGTGSSKDAVQGMEIQFLGVDEVTQHTQEDVTWLESRVRRKKNMQRNVPLRVRFTGNPGGRGNPWIKKRFGIVRNPKWDPKVGTLFGGHHFSKEPMFVGTNPEQVFIPARLIDNPYLDANEYVRSFTDMDPVTKAQLLDGDWDLSMQTRFRKTWFPRYGRRGEFYTYGSSEITTGAMKRFLTVDVAASERTGVAGEQFYTSTSSKAKAEPCWTVVCAWGLYRNFLILLDVTRGQVETPDVFSMMDTMRKKWGVHEIFVEANGVGKPVAQVARSMAMPVTEVWTVHSKIQNSYTAAVMAQRGCILLPEEAIWLQDWEDEVLQWTGHPDETNDQVDALSTAAKVVQNDILPQAENQVGGFDYVPRVAPGPWGARGWAARNG